MRAPRCDRENSLAWLNVGQAAITNLMMAGGMAYIVWGWSQGRFTAGNVVFVSTLLAQLFRPLDLLGMVYRTIRQGVIDMGAMFDLVDTPASIVDAPGATVADRRRAGMSGSRTSRFGYEPGRDILTRARPRRAAPAPRSRSSGRRARANRRSRGCCTASTT